VAGIDFDRLLQETPYQVSVGQSPFAFARGLQFEERLQQDNSRPLFTLLQAKASGPIPRTARRKIRHDPAAPHLLDGAVLSAPIGGVLSWFEADAVAACLGDRLRVAEVDPRISSFAS
jgi:hypothetical protein